MVLSYKVKRKLPIYTMARSHLQFRLTDDALNELQSFIVTCYTRRAPDTCTGRRAQIIRELHRGRNIKELSKDYRVSVRSIRQWLATYRRAGIKGLMGKPRPGVHLTEEQIWQLIHLHSKRPRKTTPKRMSGLLGLRSKRHSPWSYPRLSQWVAQNWGVKISAKRIAQIISCRFI